MHKGDVVKDVSPQVVIIPLLHDLTVFQGEPAGTVNGRRGVLFIGNDHFPFHVNSVFHHGRGVNQKGEVLGSAGESFGHGCKLFNAADLLNAVLEEDILMIIGQYMGPVHLALVCVDGCPEPDKLIQVLYLMCLHGALRSVGYCVSIQINLMVRHL